MDKNKKGEKKQKMPKEELMKVLRQYEGKCTITDLVEKTGWAWNTLRTICTNNKIEFLDPATKVEKIIMANLNLDIGDMSKLLEISASGVRVHLRRLNITLPRETIKKVQPTEVPERTIKELRETDLLGPIAKSYQEVAFIDVWNKLRYG